MRRWCSSGVFWAKWIDEKYPNSQFAIAAGLLATEESVALEDSQEIDLKSVSLFKKLPSDETPNSASKLKRGDFVTVIRRMTWNVPIKGNKDFKNAVEKGTQGTIEGWADLDRGKVILKLSLKLLGVTEDIVQDVYPRNLQLTSEYLLMKAAPPAEVVPSSSSGSTSSSGSSTFHWLLQKSDPSCVKLQEKLHKHFADNDMLNRSFWLKSRVGVALESL